MRLGGRLAAAIEVLTDIETRRRPSADALKDWGLSHRFAGSGDRAAIGNLVYDALRRKRSAAYILDSDEPRAVAIGAWLLETGMDALRLDALLDGDRFAPPPLSDAERAAFSARDLAGAPDAVRADIPDWCVPLFAARFGDRWVEEAAALSQRPPLDLRVNTLKSDRAAVEAELAETGAVPTRLATQGLRIAPIAGEGRHPNVQVEPAFRKGWFEVQDEGSQLAAEIAGVGPGMQVLDLCAGAGGKTLALAALMENRGQIYAHDSDKQRLAPIFDRLDRAGARDVQVLARRAGLAELEGRMDLVLIDAPCTGSGTWRRRPDAKWRLTDRQLDVRRAEQSALFEQAAPYVRPGGRLVYVTCSVFAEENEVQVQRFLDGAPDFTALDPQALWHQRFPDATDSALFPGGAGISLTPATSGTDGFFVSVLEKRADG